MTYKLVYTALITIATICNPPVRGQFGRTINIGLITDTNSEVLGETFQTAIDIANVELTVKLQSRHEQINYGSSMEGVKRVCAMMQEGVGAIFGPSALSTGLHLMSVCDGKDLPYILSRMSGTSDGFNLHPHPADLANALHSVISAFEWTQYTFLYENAEYLSIFNALLSHYDAEGPIVSVVRYDLNLNGNYKPVLRKVRKSQNNRLVVVGSSGAVRELLNQAQQVGIMNDDYTYIVGNLDLHTYDLEEYKFSEVNITGFRMFSAKQPAVQKLMRALGHLHMVEEYGHHTPDEVIDPDDLNAKRELEFKRIDDEIIRNGSMRITTEMALLFDAVLAFAETTKHIRYVPQSLNCKIDDTIIQEDGSTFKNYMRALDIEHSTLTGHIFFDGPRRKGYKLDVIELQQTGLVKVGLWEENKNFTFERQNVPPAVEFEENTMVNKSFVVLVAVPNAPYTTLVESTKELMGNDMYQGYAVDLIKELADRLHFNFTLKDGGTVYGSFNKTTNTTDGMLKQIIDGEADLAIADLTITAEREVVVDFTIPFMNTGIAILYLKPSKSEPTTFSFMEPFSKEVWKYLGLAFLAVAFGFFVIGRLSPNEWDNPYHCIEEPEVLENQFTINNSLWFTTGSFLQQGSEMAPKSLSTRTVSAVWSFFILTTVSLYTAKLSSFLTISKPEVVLRDVYDLAVNKAGVQYGAVKGGATRSFFATSNDPIFMNMNQYMIDHPHLLTTTNQEGVDRVANSNTKSGVTYAFLMESTSIEYHTVRHCNLEKVGELLDEKGYGIAMPKNWPYRDHINNALLELLEEGTLAKLKRKWWKEMGNVCSDDDEGEEESDEVLGVSHLEGIYYVLIVGAIISIVFGIVWWCVTIVNKARTHNVPFCAAFVEELKYAIDIRNNERQLRPAESVYSRGRNSSLGSIDSFTTDSEEEDDDDEDSMDEKYS